MSQGHGDSGHGWPPDADGQPSTPTAHDDLPADGGEVKSGRGRSSRPLIVLLGGAGALALLVVLTLVLSLLPDGADDKDDTKEPKKAKEQPAAAYEVAWRTPKPSQLDAVKPVNTFVAGDLVVRVDLYSITAYSVADGEQRWQVTVPEGQHLCAVSPKASRGVIAFGVGTDSSCAEVQAIDATDGTTVWSTELEPQGDDPLLVTSVAVLLGRVIVATNESVIAMDAKSGGEQWRTAPSNTDCIPGEVQASEDKLLSIVDCTKQETSGSKDLAVSLDPDTGESQWITKLPNKDNYAQPQIFEVSPPVLMLNDVRDRYRFRILDDKDGSVRAKLSARGEGGTLDPTEYQLGNVDKALTIRSPFIVADGTLIGMAKVADQISPLGSRVIVGISLEDGERLWDTDLGKVKDGRDFHGRVVFGQGERGQVYITKPGGNGYTKLTTVDPKTGELAEGKYVADHPETIASSVFLSAGKTLIEVSTTSITPYSMRAYTPKQKAPTATPK